MARLMDVRFQLSFRNVEDLFHEHGNDVSHEIVRFWWNRFGPMFAIEIRKNRICRKRAYSNWQLQLAEVFVKINGISHYLWRAVDLEGYIYKIWTSKPDRFILNSIHQTPGLNT